MGYFEDIKQDISMDLHDKPNLLLLEQSDLYEIIIGFVFLTYKS